MTFIAALDQSGGSTPSTLERYGVTDYNENNMMEIIHDMRVRIVTSPSFSPLRIDSAIVFKDSMYRGLTSLLLDKQIMPYLKIDNGMNEDGSLKPFDLDILEDAREKYGIRGTKMRSVIQHVDDVERIVDQQYEYAQKIRDLGYTPIVEPEVDINNPIRNTIENMLDDYLETLDLSGMIIKLTIPFNQMRYSTLSCDRLVALSGGFSLEECVEKLQHIPWMGASFSRALTEGLRVDMTMEEFDEKLGDNVRAINSVAK